MEVKFISTKLTCGQNGYGINFRGGSPVLIDTVLPSSPAEHGGLKFGDMLVELNGNDIFSFSKESVISAIKACNRGMLRLKVGRVRPIPVTADGRREAVQLVKNKLESGSSRRSMEVQNYQDQLNNSMADVEDLLKSFDLSMPVMASQPAAKPAVKHVAAKTVSSTSKKDEEGELFQELQVELYEDNDSLPSPPSSNSSEADLEEKDPLLDFTREDNLTYSSRGGGGGAVKRSAASKPASRQLDGSERPQMMKATMELNRGLQGIKNILQDAERMYEEKQNKRRIALEDEAAQQQVMTVAAFTQSQQERVGGSGGRSTAPAVTTPREKKNVPQPLNITREPVSVGSSRAGSVEQFTSSSPASRNVAPTKKPPSPVRVASSPVRVASSPVRVASSPVRVAPSSSKAMPSPSKKQFSPPPAPYSSLPSARSAAISPPSTSSTAAIRQHSKPSPPVVKPYTGSMMSPTSSSSGRTGNFEVQSRLEKGRRPEEPRRNSKEFERDVRSDRTKPQHRAPVPHLTASSSSTVTAPTTGVHTSRSPSSSPPPPVPAYNPAQPDSFPLSNQRDYVEQTQRLSSKELWGSQQREAVGVSSASDVAVRKKPVKSRERRSGGEEGVAKEPRVSGGRGSFDVQQVAPVPKTKKTRSIVDVSPLEVACNGLPESVTDWSHEEVVQWLQQLSPSLCDLYRDHFTRHDIIGRALLRLNATKLKKMDINSKHSTLLASEIVKLKIRQEKMELEELEPNQLSYL